MKPDGSLSEADVARVFNALADEYASKVEATEGKRTLQRIQDRSRAGVPRLPARRLALLTLAPAAAAAALTIAVTSWLAPDGLSYEVTGAANLAGRIEAGATPATLSFSDDSMIVAEPRTALSMSVVGEHAALARLQAGKLNVKVKHADETDWRFLAGPYEVRVVGTAFDLDWKPSAGQLSVVMHEGRVRVIGPDAGETFLNAGQSRTFGEAPKTKAVAARLDPDATGSGQAQPAVDEPSSESTPHRTFVRPALSWAKLVGKGLFSEVVLEAERSGIEHSLNTRGVQDLQALAQAAHYTGRSTLALDAWSKVRQRFGGKQAAFFMGRIHDQQGNGQGALRWLNVYLAEAGSDVYASEALGRKLTLVQRLQGKAQAEAVAREYLKRFPKGTYARTARAVLR